MSGMPRKERTIEELAVPAFTTQISLVENELANHAATSHLLSVRYRVAKKLGTPKEQLDALQKDMERTEEAINELGVILTEIRELRDKAEQANGTD